MRFIFALLQAIRASVREDLKAMSLFDLFMYSREQTERGNYPNKYSVEYERRQASATS
jgi:hypothetical protein